MIAHLATLLGRTTAPGSKSHLRQVEVFALGTIAGPGPANRTKKAPAPKKRPDSVIVRFAIARPSIVADEAAVEQTQEWKEGCSKPLLQAHAWMRKFAPSVQMRDFWEWGKKAAAEGGHAHL